MVFADYITKMYLILRGFLTQNVCESLRGEYSPSLSSTLVFRGEDEVFPDMRIKAITTSWTVVIVEGQAGHREIRSGHRFLDNESFTT